MKTKVQEVVEFLSENPGSYILLENKYVSLHLKNNECPKVIFFEDTVEDFLEWQELYRISEGVGNA